MNSPHHIIPRCGRLAFTLIELLVVLAIIGGLAALSLPAIRGFGQGNALAAAERQLSDDLGLARQYAIKNRARVYMVFAVPATQPGLADPFEPVKTALDNHYKRLNTELGAGSELKVRALRAFTNIFAGMFTQYALYTEQAVGEQPGVKRRRYLTEWRELPEGIVFPTNMSCVIPANRLPEFPNGEIVSLPRQKFPFPITPRLGDPNDIMPEFELPYVAFDPTGRLSPVKDDLPADQYLTLGFGSVLVPRLPDQPGTPKRRSPNAPDFSRPLDYIQTPFGNSTNSIFRVAALTGRTKLFKPETR